MLEKIIDNTSEYIDSMPKKNEKNTDNFLLVLKRQGIWLNFSRFHKIKIK